MNTFEHRPLSQTQLVLLRPGLVSILGPSILANVTVTTEISTFTIEVLSHWVSYPQVIVDGECLRLHDWKSTRVNLLRALTIRNAATQFYLFSGTDLTPFHLSRPNLILVPRKLTRESVEEEMWEILATKEAFWLKARSAN